MFVSALETKGCGARLISRQRSIAGAISLHVEWWTGGIHTTTAEAPPEEAAAMTKVVAVA
jgi:hypothetical protein